MTVTVTVKNQGTAAAGGFRVDLYENLSSPPVANQAGSANCSKTGLAAGGTSSCVFTVTYTAAGSYSVRAQVDTTLLVTESNESNNTFGPVLVTVGSPDLTVSSLSLPTALRVCQAVSITATSCVQ